MGRYSGIWGRLDICADLIPTHLGNTIYNNAISLNLCGVAENSK